ncbi:MAG: nucleotidyltransferase domain-containing protein [Leptospiraceae bacterium]|nr:nucleotidyltransferase domain-containing protein [Leptospiraceae bacterium]
MKYGLKQEQLQEIVEFLSRYPQIEKAILFGSRALGTYKPSSDVDIAIFGEQADWKLASQLKLDIEEETYLPYFFDIVSYNSIQEKNLKEEIDKKGVSIYERKKDSSVKPC